MNDYIFPGTVFLAKFKAAEDGKEIIVVAEILNEIFHSNKTVDYSFKVYYSNDDRMKRNKVYYRRGFELYDKIVEIIKQASYDLVNQIMEWRTPEEDEAIQNEIALMMQKQRECVLD